MFLLYHISSPFLGTSSGHSYDILKVLTDCGTVCKACKQQGHPSPVFLCPKKESLRWEVVGIRAHRKSMRSW